MPFSGCTYSMAEDARHQGAGDCWSSARHKIDASIIVSQRWTRQKHSLGLTARLTRFASRNFRERRRESASPPRPVLESAFSALNLRSLDANQDGRVSPTEVQLALQSATAGSEGGLNEAHREGDAGMYEAENLIKRYQLRNNPDILAQLEMWWAACCRELDTNADAKLDRDEYVALHRRLVRAFDEDGDDTNDLSEEDQRLSEERDWREDSKGGDGLRRCDLFDAIFELADNWTDTAEAGVG